MLSRKRFLLGMATTTVSTLLLSSWFSFSRSSKNQNQLLRRVVTIRFPSGKSVYDYHADKSSWIDAPALLEFLPWAAKKGLITRFNKESGPDFMRYTIEADSSKNLEAYEKLATLISHKNMSTLGALGYSVQVEYHLGDAHYGSYFRKA